MLNGTMIFRCLLIIYMFFYMFGLTWAGEDCKDCHKKIWSTGIAQSYVHPPFAEEKCKVCHLYKVVYKKQTTTTVIKTTSLGTEHMTYVILEDKSAVYQAVVNVRDQDGKIDKVVKEFIFSQLPIMQDKTPPHISQVEVPEISSGIFYEATVTWVTDEPSTSQVEYGETKRYGFITPLDENLVTNHQVKIHELSKEKVYYFRVISSDVFGNKSISPAYSFKVIPKTQQASSNNINQSPDPVQIKDLNIFRTPDGKIVFFWLTTKLAWGMVEIKKVPPEGPEGENKETQPHSTIVLKGKREAGLDSCYECHPQDKLGISHPVGIPLGEEMVMPSDLPLADGKIVTCDSCHNPHGSKYMYFLRKPRGRELCVSCHGDRY